MKRKATALALILCLFTFISCNKENKPDPEPEWIPEAPMPALPDPSVDIYISGSTVDEEGHTIILYWKNGSPVILGTAKDPSNYGSCGSIAVVNNDVYATAIVPAISIRYWKNGNPVLLTDPALIGITTAVAASGIDLYVTGQEYGGTVTNVYWKNGQRFEYNIFSFKSMAVNDNDIYMIGSDEFDNPLSLKNGTPVTWNKKYTNPSIYNRIFAFDGNVYTAGCSDARIYNYGIDSFISKATYWKNEQEIFLDSANNSNAYAVFVSGSDVYACGVIRVGSGGSDSKRHAAYWKNGQLNVLTEEHSYAYTIAVVNNHVYVSGTIGDKGALWIDGVLFYTLRHTSNFADMKVVPK